jgi:hypothetical protein
VDIDIHKNKVITHRATIVMEEDQRPKETYPGGKDPTLKIILEHII